MDGASELDNLTAARAPWQGEGVKSESTGLGKERPLDFICQYCKLNH